MPSNGTASTAPYRPTSLDFINRPNPVEPQSVQQQYPLNGTPRIEQTSKEGLPRLLLDSLNSSTAERPAKRRKSGDVGSKLDLPKLPAVKNGAKRMRIPPTLSGLHQPPPNAGLLPSISTEQPVRVAGGTQAQANSAIDKPLLATRVPESSTRAKRSPKATPKSVSTSKPKRNKWSDEETACLLKGVARFGMGNWTQILKRPDYHFERRTAIDLKDRFRVCCPDEYRTSKKPKDAPPPQDGESITTSNQDTPTQPVSARVERKSSAELRKIGIEEPFEKSKRRPRTNWTEKEDETLLKGFEKYGNSWSSIRHDDALNLSHRQPTDLRDRFRTKFPDRYREAGLAPRPEVFPKKPDRKRINRNPTDQIENQEDDAFEPSTASALIQPGSASASKEKENKDPYSGQPSKPVPVTSLLQYDDVFWGAPLDPDDNDFDRPTLDRGILDWPNDIARPTVPASASINPLVTMRPRPTLPDPSMVSGISQNNGTLPSLAELTSSVAMDREFMEQLELPTLAAVLGEMRHQRRTGGHVPSLEELLS
ncbi:hypothetical protein LTR09_009638 [Extremus antarcticus]|uniref:Uncharacterized protein n=1 Tax=Extremus antarcticus TaxID=702011 RepID=A0AAJ0DF69_9PEZI|nr:hypothetical protein LTR09_009638 [Extremus antarcticus]